jgi:hypothetical protein
MMAEPLRVNNQRFTKEAGAEEITRLAGFSRYSGKSLILKWIG